MAWAMTTGVPLEWIETGEDKPRPDGPGGAQGLPRLDLNQQPFGYGDALVRGRIAPLRLARRAA